MHYVCVSVGEEGLCSMWGVVLTLPGRGLISSGTLRVVHREVSLFSALKFPSKTRLMSLREKAQTAEFLVPPTCLETVGGTSSSPLLYQEATPLALAHPR